MNKILAYFRKPTSFNNKPWVVVIIVCLLVCFILAFFQPFGIENFSTDVKYYVIIGYTLVTAISTSIVGYLLPFLFKKFYNSSKWTIGKSLINNVLIILLIALGNSIFAWSIGHRQIGTFGSVFLFYILVTSLIGIIPVIVAIFIVQNNALKKNLYDAKLINDQLAKRLKDTIQLNYIEPEVIVLSGNTKETVTLYPDSILYLESSGNYIKIKYLLKGVIKQKQLRTTIAQMEKSLHYYPYIVRCHRAYMVNISYIINIEGNSQGFQLDLRYLKEKISVSRSYIKAIKDKL
jgi:hypothetical protein